MSFFSFRAPTSLFVVLFALLLIVACGDKAKLDKPKTYHKGKISFSYPSNWDIDQEVVESDIHYVVLTTPGQGLFVVQAHISDFAMSLEDFSQWFSEEARAALPLLTRSEGVFEPIESLPSDELSSGVLEKFTIGLFGQEVPHKAHYYLAQGEKLDAFIITQYRTDIEGELALGYEHIFDSLIVGP